MQQGNYPIGSRVLAGTDTLTGVVTGATADVPLNALVNFILGSGTLGTVTSVSFTNVNGFTGTVTNPATTPTLSVGTSVSGILKGNGTGVLAATAGTDYSAGTSGLATGIVKSTTGTGALAIATGADLPVMTATVGGAVPTPPNNTTTFLRGDGTFATPAGAGTVTSVSVVTANGFAGSVATPTSTPAITLTTSVTGVLKGNGTSMSAALNSDLPAMSATVGGAVPTPPNDVTKFLNGQGAFTVPAGGTGITSVYDSAEYWMGV